MGDYENAIADINFALSLSYPVETRYKLYDRLGKCHLKSGNPAKAKPAFLIGNQLVSNCDANQQDAKDVKHCEELKKSFLLSIKECDKMNLKDSDRKTTESTMPYTEQKRETTNGDSLGGSHEGLGCKLQVMQDNAVGRYVVAKGNIAAGETVLVENPYAAVLYPEKGGANCHNCFRYAFQTLFFKFAAVELCYMLLEPNSIFCFLFLGD